MRRMQRAAIAVAVSILGAAAGLSALRVARADPGYWFGGDSTLGAAVLIGTGWALVAAGLSLWWRRPESRCGPLLAAGGLAWFVPELNNPGVGSALAFTAGLALAAAAPVLVGHAVLAYPGGRLRSALERTVVAAAYVGGVLLLGVLPAVLTDDVAEGCNDCPRNLVLLGSRPAAADDLIRAGLILGCAWAVVLAILAARRLRQSSPVARPLFAAGAAYLVLVAATFAVSLERGFLSTGTLERRLWLGQAAALLAVSVAVGWGGLGARRARAAVAALVVELAQSPPPGGLRDLLAGIVGDPGLVLAYPVGESARLVDAQGRSVTDMEGRQRTALVRDGWTVAVLAHAPGLLDDEQLVDEVASAARLALENERLQAEVGARLEELRASRARIVAAGDAERKRLERDLHDGAQQRLVGLSLSLRLLRSRLPDSASLERAENELRRAIVELRELAHGIFPAVLADEGLAASVEALAEDGVAPMRIAALPEERFAAPVESAAYTVVAEAVRAASGTVGVRAERANGVLVVDVEAPSLDGLDLVALEDRVGALDGHVRVARVDGRITVHAELPCGS